MRTMQIYMKEACGVQRTGMKSLPQVLVGSMLLGDSQETLAADGAGMLADRLGV